MEELEFGRFGRVAYATNFSALSAAHPVRWREIPFKIDEESIEGLERSIRANGYAIQAA